MSELENFSNIDGYHSMNNKAIDGDLTSKLTKLLDGRPADLNNLTGRSSRIAEEGR